MLFPAWNRFGFHPPYLNRPACWSFPMHRFIFTFFVLTLWCGPLGAGDPGSPMSRRDWPQWRGPKRDAVSTETGLLKEWPASGPKLLWKTNKGKGSKSVGTGYSSISIAGGRIFTMGDRDNPRTNRRESHVFALDQKTGSEIWATPIGLSHGDGPRCTPTVDGDRVYAL